MKNRLRCYSCKVKQPLSAFTFLHEVPNPHRSLKRSIFCHDCQARRASNPAFEFRQYAGRDATLRRMGFASYADYLRSPLWSGIRTRVLVKDRYICRMCGARATQVHHNLYDRRILSGQSLEGLRSLCGPCHKSIEFDGRKKLGVNEAAQRCERAAIRTKGPTRKERATIRRTLGLPIDARLTREQITAHRLWVSERKARYSKSKS